MSREQFEAWGMSDVDLRITLESETYAGIAWMAWQAAISSMQSERDQLSAQLAAVVAENAALRRAFGPGESVMNFLTVALRGATCSNLNLCNVAEAFEASLPPTPATDAFIAEQRAQGVEKLAALAGNECQRHKAVNDRAGVRKWKSIVILCCDFAAQLRNEVRP